MPLHGISFRDSPRFHRYTGLCCDVLWPIYCKYCAHVHLSFVHSVCSDIYRRRLRCKTSPSLASCLRGLPGGKDWILIWEFDAWCDGSSWLWSAASHCAMIEHVSKMDTLMFLIIERDGSLPSIKQQQYCEGLRDSHRDHKHPMKISRSICTTVIVYSQWNM